MKRDKIFNMIIFGLFILTIFFLLMTLQLKLSVKFAAVYFINVSLIVFIASLSRVCRDKEDRKRIIWFTIFNAIMATIICIVTVMFFVSTYNIGFVCIFFGMILIHVGANGIFSRHIFLSRGNTQMLDGTKIATIINAFYICIGTGLVVHF